MDAAFALMASVNRSSTDHHWRPVLANTLDSGATCRDHQIC
jgi:hypothetical protein